MKTSVYLDLPRKVIPLSSASTKKEVLVWENTHTVCEEARCPNREECSRNNLATFLINGSICTRNCSYCNVQSARPFFAEEDREKEIEVILQAVKQLNLSYIVLTAPSRDDLEDGGSSHFLNLSKALRKRFPALLTEFLIPDFHFSLSSYQDILDAVPYVLAHNLEVVSSLYSTYRKQADYNKSLELLRFFSDRGLRTKTSLMLGLGETWDELKYFLEDCKMAGVQALTLGQYLSPGAGHPDPVKILREEDWAKTEELVKSYNFLYTEVGAFVRSSYMAHRIVEKVRKI